MQWALSPRASCTRREADDGRDGSEEWGVFSSENQQAQPPRNSRCQRRFQCFPESGLPIVRQSGDHCWINTKRFPIR